MGATAHHTVSRALMSRLSVAIALPHPLVFRLKAPVDRSREVGCAEPLVAHPALPAGSVPVAEVAQWHPRWWGLHQCRCCRGALLVLQAASLRSLHQCVRLFLEGFVLVLCALIVIRVVALGSVCWTVVHHLPSFTLHTIRTPHIVSTSISLFAILLLISPSSYLLLVHCDLLLATVLGAWPAFPAMALSVVSLFSRCDGLSFTRIGLCPYLIGYSHPSTLSTPGDFPPSVYHPSMSTLDTPLCAHSRSHSLGATSWGTVLLPLGCL